MPYAQPVGQRTNRCEGLHAQLVVPQAAHKIVDDCYRMPAIGKIESGSPATIAIATKYGNFHVFSLIYRFSFACLTNASLAGLWMPSAGSWCRRTCRHSWPQHEVCLALPAFPAVVC